VIPLRDSQPRHRTPVVTFALIAINAVVFFWELSLPEAALERAVSNLGLVPARLFGWVEWGGGESLDPARYSPLVTSMFLHGGWLHLIGNLWFLWVFGDNVEDRLGRVRYLAFYLAGGIAAGLVHAFSNPSSVIPTVGASGAIAAVLGAYIVLYPHSRVKTLIPIFIFLHIAELPAVLFLGVWFLLQLWQGYASLGIGDAGGVAWWAHAGGFAVGAVVALAVRSFGPPAPPSRPAPPRRPARYGG
jgi:membrane associated rhomboid family serine protease